MFVTGRVSALFLPRRTYGGTIMNRVLLLSLAVWTLAACGQRGITEDGAVPDMTTVGTENGPCYPNDTGSGSPPEPQTAT